MQSVYDYTEYRTFLKDWYSERKTQGAPISYRGLGKKLDLDPGFLVHILQGSRHTTEASIPKWIKALGLDAAQAEYFHQLVFFNRARSSTDIQRHFQRLCELRDMQMSEIGDKQYRYYLSWHHVAIRVLLLTEDFRGNVAELAKRIDPPLKEEEAKQAIDTLIELNLASWNQEGVLEVVSPFLTTSRHWQDRAVREFQKQTLDLAKRSLDVHPAEQRQMSTLTLAIPAEEISTLQEMAREFQQKVLRWTAGLEHSDSVFQVNVAVFPLSILPKEAKP